MKANCVGKQTEECESHVEELNRRVSIQSTAGHVKSRWKKGGPPSKPKYYPMTDREEVL